MNQKVWFGSTESRIMPTRTSPMSLESTSRTFLARSKSSLKGGSNGCTAEGPCLIALERSHTVRGDLYQAVHGLRRPLNIFGKRLQGVQSVREQSAVRCRKHLSLRPVASLGQSLAALRSARRCLFVDECAAESHCAGNAPFLQKE